MKRNYDYYAAVRAAFKNFARAKIAGEFPEFADCEFDRGREIEDDIIYRAMRSPQVVGSDLTESEIRYVVSQSGDLISRAYGKSGRDCFDDMTDMRVVDTELRKYVLEETAGDVMMDLHKDFESIYETANALSDILSENGNEIVFDDGPIVLDTVYNGKNMDVFGLFLIDGELYAKTDDGTVPLKRTVTDPEDWYTIEDVLNDLLP